MSWMATLVTLIHIIWATAIRKFTLESVLQWCQEYAEKNRQLISSAHDRHDVGWPEPAAVEAFSESIRSLFAINSKSWTLPTWPSLGSLSYRVDPSDGEKYNLFSNCHRIGENWRCVNNNIITGGLLAQAQRSGEHSFTRRECTLSWRYSLKAITFIQIKNRASNDSVFYG